MTDMYYRYTPLRNVSISQYYSDNFKRTAYMYINLFPMLIPYYTFILPSSQFKTFFVYLFCRFFTSTRLFYLVAFMTLLGK